MGRREGGRGDVINMNTFCIQAKDKSWERREGRREEGCIRRRGPSITNSSAAHRQMVHLNLDLTGRLESRSRSHF